MPLYGGIHYKTETLGEYTRRLSESSPRIAHELADNILDVLQERIRKRTPVNTAPFSTDVPGKLRLSIHKTPIVSNATPFRTLIGRGYVPSAIVYAGHVETDVSYAPFVEWETGKYKPGGEPYAISPKHGRALAFMGKDGQLHIVARVYKNPGSRGHHMFARGAATMTEASIIRQSVPVLSRWRAEFAKARPR